MSSITNSKDKKGKSIMNIFTHSNKEKKEDKKEDKKDTKDDSKISNVELGKQCFQICGINNVNQLCEHGKPFYACMPCSH
jgi:hypothetical protein